ncbi:MAG: TfoX/Sxy family protein [Nocardioides sp.]
MTDGGFETGFALLNHRGCFALLIHRGCFALLNHRGWIRHDDVMAYDEALAARIRDFLADEPGLTEKKMFGGIGFMLHGNMAAGAGSKGQLILRSDPKRIDDFVEEHIRPMEMNGRAMGGWLHVDLERIESDEDFAQVVGIGRDYALSLPPK